MADQLTEEQIAEFKEGTRYINAISCYLTLFSLLTVR